MGFVRVAACLGIAAAWFIVSAPARPAEQAGQPAALEAAAEQA